MAKRRTLVYDSAQLAESLKRSTGKGVNALFSETRQHSNELMRPPSKPAPAKHPKVTSARTRRRPSPKRPHTLDRAIHVPDRSSLDVATEEPYSPTRKRPATGSSTERAHERITERTKVRHTFDIFRHQLTLLRRIQLSREERFGRRQLIGDLVQEALDLLIAKERNNA